MVMNILYGIQTTGHGHFIRSRSMIKKLKSRGHNVFSLLSGPPLKSDWDLSVFEPCSYHQGLTFVTEKGRIRVSKTIKQADFIGFYKDIITFNNFRNIDLVISDYEPITARIAKLRRIPSVGIGHMYAFHYRVPVATFNPVFFAIMRWFSPVDHPIGLHWFHYNKPILPPTIPDEVQNIYEAIPDKILVYLGFEDLDDIKDFLRPIKSHHFYIYFRVDKPSDEGNLHIRPFSRTNFLKDLGESSGVISNGGFSLASEALHLGKKLLIKPVKGQIEQYCNALALLRLELGSSINKLDTEAVREWLTFPQIKPMNYANVMDPFIEWIESGNLKDTSRLVSEAWASSKAALSENHNFISRDFHGNLQKYYLRYLRKRTPI